MLLLDDLAELRFTPEYRAISEQPNDDEIPWLDRTEVFEESIATSRFADYLREWRRDGVVTLRDYVPKSVREAYFEARAEINNPNGWIDDCPYLYVPEMRELSLHQNLVEILDELLGLEVGLHLNLTGWVSTERAWHQDDYLNPPFVNSHYAAVWFALRDIHPDSGPFEYVPGSHRWPLSRRDKILAACPVETSVEDHEWPTKTQDWVADIFDKEIAHQGVPVKQFLAKEGDILIWHGRLVHRGSRPRVPGMPRHSLISHYSAMDKRPDMKTWYNGCYIPAGRESEWV